MIDDRKFSWELKLGFIQYSSILIDDDVSKNGAPDIKEWLSSFQKYSSDSESCPQQRSP